MNTKLFRDLITYVAHKEESSYWDVWGKRFFSRLRGKAKALADISFDESVNTKRDYETVKLRVNDSESVDDLLLMCERGIIKHDEASGFLKNLRIITLLASLIFVNLSTVLGVLEVGGIRDKAKQGIISCKNSNDISHCKKEIKEKEGEHVKDVIEEARWKAVLFSIFLSIIGLLVVGVLSNDKKGRVNLDLLSLYLRRLKLEREGGEVLSSE